MIVASNESSLVSVYLEVGLRIAREQRARAFLVSAPTAQDLRGWYRVRGPRGDLVGLCKPGRGDVARATQDPLQCDLVPLGGRMVPVYLRAILADLLGVGSPADLKRWAAEAEQYRGPRNHHPGLTL